MGESDYPEMKRESILRGGGGGSETVHRQDSSPTRILETVHRHIWRQFTDTFGDSSPTQFFQRMFMSMEIMFHILIEENVGKLKTKILRLIQYFEYRQGTRMRRLMYENFLSH